MLKELDGPGVATMCLFSPWGDFNNECVDDHRDNLLQYGDITIAECVLATLGVNCIVCGPD